MNSTATATTAPLPPPSFSSLSTSEIQYLVSGSFENFRIDGRSNEEYRPYSYHRNSSIHGTGPFLASNGSCRVFLPGSATDILCSIKADLVRPSPLRPDEGVLELNVDTLPSFSGSGGSNSSKTRRMEEMELSSIFHDLFLPFIVKKTDLCVVVSRYVWRLHIDLVILCCDGCVIDICSMAIRCALQNLILPTLTPVTKHAQLGEYNTISSTSGKVSDDLILDGDINHAFKVSSSTDCPVIVTVYLLEKSLEKELITPSTNVMKIQKRGAITYLVDARSEEEVCACAKVSVSVDPSGNICGIYSYGNSSSLNSTPSSIGRGSMGTIPVVSLNDITKAAVNASKTVFNNILQLKETRTSLQDGDSYLDILKGCFDIRL